MPQITMEYNFRGLTGQRLAPGNTATAISTNVIKYTEHKLQFTSGGTTEIVAGHRILGATSGAQAMVLRVVKTSGTWAGGDAAGWLYLCSVAGTFQNAEKITVEGVADDGDVVGTAIELAPAEYVRPEFRGMTARKLTIQAESNDLRISWNGLRPAQVSKAGLLLGAGSIYTLTDAADMAACLIIDAVAGSVGYANIVGHF